MNSPLDLREDRLRGLCLQPIPDRTVPAGDFAWFQRRIHSLLVRRAGHRRILGYRITLPDAATVPAATPPTRPLPAV